MRFFPFFGEPALFFQADAKNALRGRPFYNVCIFASLLGYVLLLLFSFAFSVSFGREGYLAGRIRFGDSLADSGRLGLSGWFPLVGDGIMVVSRKGLAIFPVLL